MGVELEENKKGVKLKENKKGLELEENKNGEELEENKIKWSWKRAESEVEDGYSWGKTREPYLLSR